jgi:hypothetical protein
MSQSSLLFTIFLETFGSLFTATTNPTTASSSILRIYRDR